MTIFQFGIAREHDRHARARSKISGAAAATSIAAYLLALPLSVVRQQGSGWSGFARAGAWVDGFNSASGLTLGLVIAGMIMMLTATAQRKPNPVLPGFLRRLAALAGAGLAVGSVLLVGHTRTYSPTWLVMGVDAMHALAASVWFGGLIALIVYLRRAAPGRQPAGDLAPATEVQDAATVVGRFSVLAGWAVAALAASGTVLALIILGSWQALWQTNYGRTLLIKLGLAGVVGVLAWWNHSRLVPAVQKQETAIRQWRRLKRAIIDEAAILTLVIAVTGALVVQSPEGNAGQQQQTPAASSTFSTPFGQHDVTGTITPGASGENIIDFTLLDHAGQPISMQGLPELAARLPAAELGPLAGKVKSDSQPGHFRATVNLPISGQWQVIIRARVSKFEEPAAHLTVTVR